MFRSSPVRVFGEDLLFVEGRFQIFYLEQNFPRSSIRRKPFQGLIFGVDLFQVLYSQKIFSRFYIYRRPFPGLKFVKDLFQITIWRRPFLSIQNSPFPDLLLYEEDLSQAFFQEKTFRRSSIRRSLFPGLLFGEDLSHIFYLDMAFPKSSFWSSFWRRHFACLLYREYLSKVFYLKKKTFPGLLFVEVLFEIFYSEKTFPRFLFERGLSQDSI